MAISTKLNKVLFKLCNLYFPFNRLSPERAQEIVNHVRIIELRQGEILQLRGHCQDYLYLLEGEIDVVNDGSIHAINTPSDTQRSPVILPPDSRSSSVLARQDCIICHADRETLDSIIAWDVIGRQFGEAVKYLDLVRNTLVFRRLPLELVETAFSRMRRKRFVGGDSIDSEQCDAYYLIIAGRAEVRHNDPHTGASHLVTQLGVGDIFGHAAQTSHRSMSETVTLLEDSEVLVLEQTDYQQLIERPLVKTVQPAVARTMIDNGYQLLDVRYPEEHAEQRIPNAKLIPLAELNQRLAELNRKQPYIVYCHSGPRSALAALLLGQQRFEILSLQGGIRDWPFDVEHCSSKPNVVSITKKFH